MSILASIVIPVHNNLELTRQCLETVWSTSGPPSSYEIIVVDNASDDGTAAFLKQLGDKVIAIANDKNLGFVSACNQSLTIARGKYLVFLNNDVFPREGWLVELLNLAERGKKVGIVGAKLLYPDGKLQEAGGIIWADGTGANYGRGDDPAKAKYNFIREVDYCSGACLLVRADLFRELGGFDPRYSPGYFEDADLCFAARDKGWMVLYNPKAEVVHLEGATSGRDLSRGMKNFQVLNRPKFVAKWAAKLSLHFTPNARYLDRASDRTKHRNILIVDPLLPHFDRMSGAAKMMRYIKILLEEGHHITYLPENGAGQDSYKKILEEMGVAVYATLEDKRKLTGTMVSHINRECLKKILGEKHFSLVILSFWYIAEEFLPIVREISPGSFVAIDTHDIHYLRETRLAYLKGDKELMLKSLETKKKELNAYKGADTVITVTENDRDVLLSEISDLPVTVIPNIHCPLDQTKGFEERRDLLYIGFFGHPPNVDAVNYLYREIMPLISQRLPGVKLFVVGSSPPQEISQLAGEQVIVTGYVPDLQAYLQRCRVLVAPLRYGAGMKGKIGEAMGSGLPVVTTPMGAEGMKLVHEKHALIADTPNRFADAVERLYNSEATWNSLAAQGKEHIRKHYSPNVVRFLWRNVLDRARDKMI